MKIEVIQQGAEAKIIYNGKFVIKDRVKKGYRIKEMDDAIRRRRTKREVKLLNKASEIISAPKPFFVPDVSYQIKMPFIDGLKLSERLDEMRNWKEVCIAIGENIAKLHDADIIHGDLTTSNMIWVSGEIGRQTGSGAPSVGACSARKANAKFERSGVLYFIDFGLGFSNGKFEDKAVDLYLIKGALEAKHFKRFEKYFAAVLEGYRASKNYRETLKRLEKVEKRGRYKQNY